MSRLSRFFRLKKYRKQRNRLLIISAAALAVFVLGFLMHRAFTRIEGPKASIPSDEILVHDRYEGQKLIPKYSIAKNTYRDSTFSVENGIRAYADKNASKGVDVSSWQGNINWAKVKKAGMTFAFIRVGYRGQTKGTIFDDEKFTQNMEGASAAGLKLGVYFYSQAVTASEAAEEADYVVKKIRPYHVTWPVVFDWEPGEGDETSASGLRTQSVAPEQVSSFTKVFCDRVKAASYQPCFYTNKNMGYTTFDLKLLSSVPMWYAEYRPLPSFYYHFDIWQYASKGHVDGISGNADINIAFRKFG